MPIAPIDIKLFRSSNGSLGGAVTSTAIGTNVFDAVTSAEATAGRTEYRCVYARNDSGLALENAVLAVQSDSTSPRTVLGVGVGSSGMNGVEQAVSAENVAPSGVTFGSSANLGTIPAGQMRSIWLRRVVTAGAAALNPDASNLRLTGSYTDAEETETFFDSLTYTDGSDTPWAAQNGRPLVLALPGSSGSNLTTGRQYRAGVSGNMAFDAFTEFAFSLVAGYRTQNGATAYHVNLRPVDRWVVNGTVRESMHTGFQQPDGRVYLTAEHRYDRLMQWALANLTQYNLKQRVISGGSMGAWGSITYGIPRADMFAAIYADRPRWRYGSAVGAVAVAVLNGPWANVPVASAPLLSVEDGGSSYAAHVDMIAYVSNTANKVAPVLWCLGRQDGFATFDDQIAAVNALRAAGRAFAFVWNDGNHSTGSIMEQLLRSYPYGTYELGRGYPLFTEHSGDQDPNVDLVGGINEGLSFRNVVETSTGWSCEVTSILGPRTVKVKPISDVFAANVAAKTVNISAANAWAAVSFTA